LHFGSRFRFIYFFTFKLTHSLPSFPFPNTLIPHRHTALLTYSYSRQTANGKRQNHHQANDGEAYATACAEFDRITPLDPWKTSILLKAKKSISGEGSAENELC
jgi:hypothetical protein